MTTNKRNQSLLQLALLIGIAIFINILGNVFHKQIDLTEEGRFTLTNSTVRLLENVDDNIDITILLEGEFPAGFKRLQTATKEILDDFRSVSGFIEYSFEDPNEGTTEEISARRKNLAEQGIGPTRLRVKGVDGMEERYIYPFAMVYYKGRTLKVNLLENEVAGKSDEMILNNSVSLLEYKFANAILKLKQSFRSTVIYTTGHGELEPLQIADLRKTLAASYDVGAINMDSVFQLDPKIDVLLIANPQTPFSEKDKFKLDQYIMNGGKVIWMLDVLNVNLDSIARRGIFIPSDRDLNLADLLFKHGIRVSGRMVADMECSKIPLQVGQMGNTPQLDLFPWFFHPIVSPKSNHPIVKGLDRVNLFFPTAIDTSVVVKTDLKKTVLLSSSKNSKEYPNLTRLSFEMLRVDPATIETFTKPEIPVAVLYEGIFPSAYENRVSAAMQENLNQIGASFKTESVPTKMIVISDGEIVKNQVKRETGEYMPAGYNKYENYTFANKDFLINCIEYLMDEQGVIEARGKEVKLRLLDSIRAKKEQTKWQVINIVLPLIFLAIFGFVFFTVRKRRYAR